jgi:acyl-CoA synthetase (NDP forming)
MKADAIGNAHRQYKESPHMRDVTPDNSVLGRFFQPRSLAILGASPRRGSARNTLVRVVLKQGFKGPIYPVNPSHPDIEGLKTYPSLDALPEVPDLALVITPAETVPDIIAQCGRKGIRAAIVYSAGFEEVESGKEHARRLARAAREHNVAILGPNCQGVWSLADHAIFSFSGAALALEAPKQAPIAVISQSGALAGAIGNYLQTSGIGCSYIVSVGNETCLDLIELLGWVIEQDNVRVVALYLEGLNDAGRLIAVARRARRRGVQIVALKAGRSAVGQKATASHTGKIASSHAVYAEVMEQAGIITVNSLTEALSAIEVLGFMPPPRLSGDPKGGVAVLSSSGGAGALLADHSDEFGVAMAEFSPATSEALEAFLPEFAHKANPVDLTGQIYSIPNLFGRSCDVIGADPRTEAMVVQFASSGRRNVEEYGDSFKQTARREGLPMILSFVGETMDRATRDSFREAGVLMCDDTAVAMRALSWLYRRQRVVARPAVEARPPLPTRPAPLTWPDIMAYCADSLIQPARWTVLGLRDKAADACAGLRYPLVVKVLPGDAEHKTELGLVKLRVATAEEVDLHAADFRHRLDRPDLSVLVQEMVPGGVEVVLSCLRKTDFGPVLSIGSGGVAIELYRDIVHLALPVSPAEVLTALRRLKLWTLLQGYRGQPRADIEALARAAVRFGDLFLATPEVTEFEINPLIVRPDGEGVIAVDALVGTEASAGPGARLLLET